MAQPVSEIGSRYRGRSQAPRAPAAKRNKTGAAVSNLKALRLAGASDSQDRVDQRRRVRPAIQVSAVPPPAWYVGAQRRCRNGHIHRWVTTCLVLGAPGLPGPGVDLLRRHCSRPQCLTNRCRQRPPSHQAKVPLERQTGKQQHAAGQTPSNRLCCVAAGEPRRCRLRLGLGWLDCRAGRLARSRLGGWPEPGG